MENTKNDDGFGLIEIVVAMFILALLAIALLPLLIQGVKIAATNATMATATQLLDGALDTASQVTVCGGLSTSSVSATDSRGIALTVTKAAGTCPSTYPGTVSYTVTVTRTDTSAVLATAITYVYVTGG